MAGSQAILGQAALICPVPMKEFSAHGDDGNCAGRAMVAIDGIIAIPLPVGITLVTAIMLRVVLNIMLHAGVLGGFLVMIHVAKTCLRRRYSDQ